MPLLGRKFPAQIGLVILYGVNSAANAMAQSFSLIHVRKLISTADEYKNDPRNPALKNQAPNH
ncbi:hypothetical protein J4E91_000633 [Alternaria rosae]|nr:hypothetical protein J4E91_000633 [Alternaria rosae]